MSPRKAVFIDLIEGRASPLVDFGEVRFVNDAMPADFLHTVEMATARFREVFGRLGDGDFPAVEAVDRVIDRMWKDDWDPERGNVDLFVTDFGCLVAHSLRQSFGGVLVLRSNHDATHASLWWREQAREVFPFHAVHHRLTISNGPSLASLERRIRRLLVLE